MNAGDVWGKASGTKINIEIELGTCEVLPENKKKRRDSNLQLRNVSEIQQHFRAE